MSEREADAGKVAIPAFSARDQDWLAEVVPRLGEVQAMASALAIYGATVAFGWAYRAFWACGGRGEIALSVVAAVAAVWLARSIARSRKTPAPRRFLTMSERAALSVALRLGPGGPAAKAARLLRDGAVGPARLHEAIWAATSREAIRSSDPIEALHRREPRYALIYGVVLVGLITGAWVMGPATCP